MTAVLLQLYANYGNKINIIRCAIHKQCNTLDLVFISFVIPVDMMSMGKSMVKELLGAFPGIDEAMSFAEVMRYGLSLIGLTATTIVL